MKNRIQRLTDGKYLISVEADTWTNVIEDSTEFTEGRLMIVRLKVLARLKITEIAIVPVVAVPETPVTPEPPVVDTPPTENNAPIVEPPAPDMSAPTN